MADSTVEPSPLEDETVLSASASSADEAPVQFSKTFRIGEREVVVVDTAEQLNNQPTDAGDAEVCVFGSEEHLKALRERLKNLTEKADHAAQPDPEHKAKKDTRLAHELKHVEREIARLQKLGMSTDGVELHDKSSAFGPTVYRKIHHESSKRVFFRKPRVRQYFQNGLLHREEEERKTAWLELFSDLTFVAVVSTIGKLLIAHPTSSGLEEFILLFYPIYRLWTDLQMWLNIHGSDDLFQKCLIFFTMCMTLFLGASASRVFSTSATDYLAAIVVTRSVYGLVYFGYAFFLPNFRVACIRPGIVAFIGAAMFFILIWIPSDQLKAVWWAFSVFDLLFPAVSTMLVRAFTHILDNGYRPALNIEHQSERLGLFTIIVLGESILAMTEGFAHSEGSRLSPSFFLVILSLWIIACIQYLYFEACAAIQFEHAVRRHAGTGILWNVLHTPFHMTIVIGAESIALLVPLGNHHFHEDTIVEGDEVFSLQSLRWLFCGGFGVALAVIGLMGLLHRSLDPLENVRVRALYRLLMRVASGIIVILLPLAKNDLQPLEMTVVVACIFGFQTGFEAWASVPLKEQTDNTSSAGHHQKEQKGTGANVPTSGVTLPNVASEVNPVFAASKPRAHNCVLSE